jgi:hypothetical protein
VRHDAQREAKDLLQRLRERPRIHELTVNPLLLTMIANVHNYRGVLPERRIELYAEICDVLLGHWQTAKGVKDTLTPAQKREVLQPLAQELMMDKTRAIATQDALAVITPHLVQVGMPEDDGLSFLKFLQANSGLLLEQEADLWGFAHLTFQEYLCAVYWKDSEHAAAWGIEEWQALIEDGWWHETLRLYAAQRDATPLVRACLQLNTKPALELADNLATEALKLETSLRPSIQKALAERSVIRLRSEPLAELVSSDDFRKVFELGANRRPLEYIQNAYEDRGEVVVDHATGLLWQKAGSDESITYKDALKYVAELNEQTFAGFSDWRLPTIPELMSLLEPEKQENGLYINSIFNDNQTWCWSSHKRSPESAWNVYFSSGYVGRYYLYSYYYVRAVRSRQC